MNTHAISDASAAQKTVIAGSQRKLPVKGADWPRIRDTKATRGRRYVVDLRPVKYGPGSRLYFETLDDPKLKAKELAIRREPAPAATEGDPMSDEVIEPADRPVRVPKLRAARCATFWPTRSASWSRRRPRWKTAARSWRA